MSRHRGYATVTVRRYGLEVTVEVDMGERPTLDGELWGSDPGDPPAGQITHIRVVDNEEFVESSDGCWPEGLELEWLESEGLDEEIIADAIVMECT